ncbi:MAG: hypothetical protein HFE79_08855 [Ruminiclostridium sp.]|jgi:hypothetical protein|nr:hypothetical protein [Ruminiclostridium sp.]
MFFGKKKRPGFAEDSVTKYVKTLPRTKKVQFCYLKPKELEEMLDKDISSVLILQPVNYYAEKSRFWQCVFFFDDEYNNIVMRFELYEKDRKSYGGKYRRISAELYGKILMKFGQRLN